MAKLRTKAGQIILEYDSKAETVETEYNGVDKWTFKIIHLKPVVQSTLIPLVSADEMKTTTAPELKELENVTAEQITKYIKTKTNFEHDTIELQEKFLKRRVTARKEQKLYFAFDRLVREAKKLIENEYPGKWESSMTRKSYGGRNYANIYRFIFEPIAKVRDIANSKTNAPENSFIGMQIG